MKALKTAEQVKAEYRAKGIPLSTIANINDDELTADEALLFAVGEHLVADWTVEDENGENCRLMARILPYFRSMLMTLWHF